MAGAWPRRRELVFMPPKPSFAKGAGSDRLRWADRVDAWAGIRVPGGGVKPSRREAPMERVITIRLNIAKPLFPVHVADAGGYTLFHKCITRRKLVGFRSS
jgi:hypothetical protein